MKVLSVNLLLSLFAAALFLAALEVSTRIYFHAKNHLNEYEERIELQGFTPGNKKPGEKRIFVVGESAVEGIPYSTNQSFPAFLGNLFEQSGAGNIKVINTGIKGRHSFYEYEEGKTLTRYKADAVIIYAGNNDTRDFSNVLRDVPFAWLDFKLTWNSYFYRMLKRRFFSFKKYVNRHSKREFFSLNMNDDDAWHWTDLYIAKKRKFMENPALGLERKAAAVRDYEENLLSLVRYLKKRDVQVFICELPINYHFPPGISDFKKGVGPGGKGYEIYERKQFNNEAEASEWEKNFEAGNTAFTEGNFLGAVELFQRAEKIYDLYPPLAHLTAQAYEKAGDYAKAREYYVKGKDLQIQSPGGDSLKTAALKNIARKTGAPLISLQDVFESVSPHGMVGENTFLDHCHLNSLGNKLVASRIMQGLCENGFAGCPAPGKDWQFWFSKITGSKLDDANIAKEYLMTAFYLINGTEWEKEPALDSFEKALYYLEQARDLTPENPQIYPLLARAYLKTAHLRDSREALARLKALSPAGYEKTILEYPELNADTPAAASTPA